jgi:hypothetical protein
MKVTELTKAQKKVIDQLRDAGFAIILWTPEELQGTPAITMEDRSTEFGWGIIEDHGGRWTGLDDDEDLEDLAFPPLSDTK